MSDHNKKQKQHTDKTDYFSGSGQDLNLNVQTDHLGQPQVPNQGKLPSSFYSNNQGQQHQVQSNFNHPQQTIPQPKVVMSTYNHPQQTIPQPKVVMHNQNLPNYPKLDMNAELNRQNQLNQGGNIQVQPPQQIPQYYQQPQPVQSFQVQQQYVQPGHHGRDKLKWENMTTTQKICYVCCVICVLIIIAIAKAVKKAAYH